MAKENKNTGNVPHRGRSSTPQLRFPGFEGEWEVKKLGEVCNVLMCKRIFAEQTSEIEEIPFYKIGTLGGRPDAYINRKLFEDYRSKYNFPKNGEVLVTCSGTVGKCIVFDGTDAYYQDSNIVWIDNPTLEITNGLLYYILSNYNWGKLNSTTIARIYGSDLRNLKLRYPKESVEQKKIVALLSLLDNRIVTQSKTILYYESLIQNLRDKIFKQKLRFKDENGSDFPKWIEKKLGELLKIGNGKDYKHLQKGDVPVFGTGGYMTSVNDYLYSGETVCIGRKGTINKPIYHNGKLWTVDTLFYSYLFEACIPKFIFYLFQSINWLAYNEASGVPSLSKATIEKITVNIPSVKEQIIVSNFLSTIDSKIKTEKKILEQLEKQKKYFLQQMFC